MKILLLVGVLAACALPLGTDIPPAIIHDLANDTINQSVFNGDQYKHTFPDLNFEFSSQVYERNDPLTKDIVEDFEGDNDRQEHLYKISKKCWLERTHVTFEKTSQTPVFKKGIDAYLFDTTETVYILSESTVYSYLTEWDGDNINLKEQFHTQINPEISFNSSQATFANIKSKIYLTDGSKMLLLTDQKGDDLRLTGFKLSVTTFVGMVPANATFLKMIAIDSNTFLSLSTNSVSKYKIKGGLDIDQDLTGLPKTLQNNTNSFTDGITDDKHLYILEESKIYVLDLKDMSKYTVHEINLGVCTRIEKVANTLEIICEYHKNVFVAQVIIQGDAFYLNRFYDQINKIQDIDFYNGKGFYIGQHQILIISHSINRNNLLEIQREHMKSYASFGIHYFDVLVRYSDRTRAALIGVSDQRAMILKLQEIPPTLNCDFNDAGITTKTLLVEFNTSFCGFEYWEQWREKHSKQDIFCRRRVPFVFNVALALPVKSQNLITMTVVMVTLGAMLLLLVIASRWATKMQFLMKQMTTELSQKQNPPDTGKNILMSHIALVNAPQP